MIKIFLLILFVSINFGKIIEINNENYNSVMLSQQYSILFFFDPICYFCNEFRPIFENFCNNSLKDIKNVRKINITCGQVNILEEEFLSQHFQAKEIPKLMLFKRNKPIQIFNGIRDEDNLFRWILKSIRLEPIKISCSWENFVKLANEKDSVAIFFFKKDSKNLDTYHNQILNKLNTILPKTISFAFSECDKNFPEKAEPFLEDFALGISSHVGRPLKFYKKGRSEKLDLNEIK